MTEFSRWARRLARVAVHLTLLNSSQALACSCGEMTSLAARRENAEFVFTGQVLETWPVALRTPDGEIPALRYRVGVLATWKGDLEAELSLLSAGSDCDYRLRQYTEYLLLVTRGPFGSWTASRCSGTRELEGLSAADYEALGPARIVWPRQPAAPESLSRIAVRRLRLASLASSFSFKSLSAHSKGDAVAWLSLAYRVAFLSWFAAVGILFVRRRWRLAAILVASSFLLGALAWFGWGYHYVLSDPWLRYMAE